MAVEAAFLFLNTYKGPETCTIRTTCQHLKLILLKVRFHLGDISHRFSLLTFSCEVNIAQKRLCITSGKATLKWLYFIFCSGFLSINLIITKVIYLSLPHCANCFPPAILSLELKQETGNSLRIINCCRLPECRKTTCLWFTFCVDVTAKYVRP